VVTDTAAAHDAASGSYRRTSPALDWRSSHAPVHGAISLSRPSAALPAYEVTLDEVLAWHKQLYPRFAAHEKSQAGSTRLVESSGVQTRRWVRPPDAVLGPRDLGADLAEPVAALRELAAEAAAKVLAEQGLVPDDIACVIVTSATGWEMPGIDVHVANALGLPQTVRRIPVAQIGCAGGVWAAARAWEQLAVYPEDRILIISAEAWSVGLHEDDVTTASYVYRGIAADGVYACIAAAELPRPGLRVYGPAFDFTLHDTAAKYQLTVGPRGAVFESENDAPLCVPKSLAALREWLRFDHPDAWPLDFMICHNGGVRILETVAGELRLPPDSLRHSRASLRERGNMTSAGVWDVMARTDADPPPSGSRGLMLAFGPGFTACALRVRWEA
jgi:predicted naringenin-chalcone synthase